MNLSLQKYMGMFLLYHVVGLIANQDSMHISVNAIAHEKIKIGLSIVGPCNFELQEVCDTIAADFLMTDQCQLVIKNYEHLDKKSQVKKMFSEQIYLLICLSQEDLGTISWRLYDTQQGEMIAGKKYHKKGLVVRGWGHAIADQIWPICMGNPTCFASKIAYCKQLWFKENGQDKVQKHIYIADANGGHERPLVQIPTVCLAPRWSNQPADPLLFYSENTVSNVRLVVVNMHGKRRTICSFDGLNMLPAFSQDHKHIVFCLSKDGSTQLYHSYLNGHYQRVFDRLTHNMGDNFSPCYQNDHTIIFVSDYATKYPAIYSLDIKTLQIEPICTDGYAACPDYSIIKNQLLYSKMVGKVMQIFIYDFATKTHRQLTNGAESKEEGCWSACGNFIMFAARKQSASRIARFNLLTGTMSYVTPASEHCTYPAWSCIYENFVP